MSDTCINCGGLIAEPGKAYGWGGKFCLCARESQICKPMMARAGIVGLDSSIYQKLLDERDKLQDENSRLKMIIAKEFSENDDLGSEFVYVSILRGKLEIAVEALEKIRSGLTTHQERVEFETKKLAFEALKEIEG